MRFRCFPSLSLAIHRRHLCWLVLHWSLVMVAGHKFTVQLQQSNSGEVYIFITALCPPSAAEWGLACMTSSSQSLLNVSWCQERGIRPVVHIQTQPISGTSWSSIQHHLITLGKVLDSRGGDGGEGWIVSIPSSIYLSSLCLYILVEDSFVGVSIERRSLLECPVVSNMADPSTVNLCPGGSCVVVDSYTEHPDRSLALVQVTVNGTFLLKYYSTDDRNWTRSTPVPTCVPTDCSESVTPYRWVLVSESLCSQNGSHFHPTHVYATSRNDLFLTGNGLIYSPDRGQVFYLLCLGSNTTVRDFSFAPGGVFVFSAHKDESLDVWLGQVGSVDILRIYPSPLMEAFLSEVNCSSSPSSVGDPTQLQFQFDGRGQLHLNISGCPTGGSHLEVALPLVLLITESLYRRSISIRNTPTSLPAGPSLTHSSLHHWLVLENNTASRDMEECPILHTAIQAPGCAEYTRTQLTVDPSLTRVINTTYYTELNDNCSLSVGKLPPTVYLSHGANYSFSVILYLRRMEEPSVFLSSSTSDPGAVNVSLSHNWSSKRNTKTVHITLQDTGLRPPRQVDSGSAIVSTTVTFQVWNTRFMCLKQHSEGLTIPDHLETSVHIGCPPGLRFAYDAEESQGYRNQYCQSENISCLYFENEFHPVFKVHDEVTGRDHPYWGSYTLRAVAGGGSVENMELFEEDSDVESGLWTAIDDNSGLFDANHNGIQWLCSPKSPCGELLPVSGGAPEYYLLLEASNIGVGMNVTYCNFTVRFLVRVHGLGMGMTATVSSFLVSLAVMVVIMLLGFACWHWKVRLLYFSDLAKERVQQRVHQVTEHVRDLVRRHRATVTPAPTRDSHAEEDGEEESSL